MHLSIYMCQKSLERIRFCYYPYQHMPLHQSVNVLCRFLIDHIDYDDRRSLELAYGLFQESLRENLSISVIVGCIKDRLENATNDSCDSKVSSVQISSQINKQITDQECKQSDSKQTDSGQVNRKKHRKYSRKNNIKMCSKCQIHLRGKKQNASKKIVSYSYWHIIDYGYFGICVFYSR